LQLLDADSKRVHIFHSMYHGITGELLATGEQMLMHVDMEKGKSCPMPQELQDKLQAILKAHAHLPQPTQAGQSIGIRRK
jgi:acyl-CoA thioesterase FadM